MSNKKVRVYLASQIFAECWRDYNEKLAQAIEEAYPEVELYVPQRNKSINDKTKCATAEQITYGDFTNNLDKDDIVVAIVDGDTPGIGTTLEIGYFSRICQEEIEKYGATKKKIISLYTDSRECSNTYLEAKNEMLKEFAECQYSYLNLLLVGCLKRYGVMCRTIDEVIVELGKALSKYEIKNDNSILPKNFLSASTDVLHASLTKTTSVEKNNLNNLNLEPIKCPICQSPHVIVTIHSLLPNKDLTSVSYNCLSCGHEWLQNDEAKTKE